MLFRRKDIMELVVSEPPYRFILQFLLHISCCVTDVIRKAWRTQGNDEQNHDGSPMIVLMLLERHHRHSDPNQTRSRPMLCLLVTLFTSRVLNDVTSARQRHSREEKMDSTHNMSIGARVVKISNQRLGSIINIPRQDITDQTQSHDTMHILWCL